MRRRDKRIILVHTPVHASWLNQVEIYFSIIQRKVLTPNDFATLDAVRLRLALYEQRLFRFLVRASRDLWAFLLGEGRFPRHSHLSPEDPEQLSNRTPRPFAWKFTRQDLLNWLKRGAPHVLAASAA